MTDRFRLHASLGRRLEELGVSLVAVLRRAGLPVGLFEQSRILVTTEEMSAFYQAVREMSTDPGIGLKLGSEERPERYSPVAIAALYSRSFGDALQRIARYKRLVSPQEIRITQAGRVCAVEFVWLLAETAEAPVWIDMCFAWTVTIGRRGTGRGIHPLRVEFRRPEAHRRLYENHFGCPVKFGARRNRLLFRAEDVTLPFITHNAEMLELVAPQLEAELRRQLSPERFSRRAKAILKTMLAGQKPRVEDVAAELRISNRTFQRRLLEEGVTFHELVEEVRREMARQYLRQASLELSETAYLLGYEDPNSFIRAFHKWEGTSPGQWRSTQRPDAS